MSLMTAFEFAVIVIAAGTSGFRAGLVVRTAEGQNNQGVASEAQNQLGLSQQTARVPCNSPTETTTLLQAHSGALLKVLRRNAAAWPVEASAELVAEVGTPGSSSVWMERLCIDRQIDNR